MLDAPSPALTLDETSLSIEPPLPARIPAEKLVIWALKKAVCNAVSVKVLDSVMVLAEPMVALVVLVSVVLDTAAATEMAPPTPALV